MELKDIIKTIKELPEDKVDEFIAKRIEYLSKNHETQYAMITPNASQVMMYSGFLVPHKNQVSIDFFEHIFRVDDLETIYKMMIDKIKKSDPKNIEDIFKCVSGVVFDYVGGPAVDGTMADRMSHFTPEDDLPEDGYNVLSNIKGTKHAFCVERAVITHELLYFLSLKSMMVFSQVEINGNMEVHCYNLTRGKSKAYGIDTSLIDFSSKEAMENPVIFKGNLEDVIKMQNIPKRTIYSSKGEKREITYNPKNRSVSRLSLNDKEFFNKYDKDIEK